MINRTALVTGGAVRIGKDICQKLHANGYNIICHYNRSEDEASELKASLNKLRKNSCEIYSFDLNNFKEVRDLVEKIKGNFDSLDILLNDKKTLNLSVKSECNLENKIFPIKFVFL